MVSDRIIVNVTTILAPNAIEMKVATFATHQSRLRACITVRRCALKTAGPVVLLGSTQMASILGLPEGQS